MKIVIAVPSNDTVHTDFCMSLSLMISYTNTTRPDIELALINPRCSLIQKGRQEAVELAQKMKADYLFFLDSDMTFPHDTLIRLLECGVGIIGCDASLRRQPFTTVAKDIKTDRPFKELDYNTLLLEVSTVGTAVLLISMEAFKKMDAPYFDTSWNTELKTFTGEDKNFCKRVRKLGWKIHIHGPLSRKIGHIGTKTFYISK